MPCRVVGLSEMVAETLRCLCNIAKLLKNYNNPGVKIGAFVQLFIWMGRNGRLRWDSYPKRTGIALRRKGWMPRRLEDVCAHWSLMNAQTRSFCKGLKMASNKGFLPSYGFRLSIAEQEMEGGAVCWVFILSHVPPFYVWMCSLCSVSVLEGSSIVKWRWLYRGDLSGLFVIKCCILNENLNG